MKGVSRRPILDRNNFLLVKQIIIENDKKYSYKDYMEFDECERWEIIDGIAYMLSSGSSPLHQETSGKITVEIWNYLKDKKIKSKHVFYRPLAVFLPKKDETVKTASSIVDPANQIIDRFHYDENLKEYKKPEYFARDDTITPKIFPDLQIKLEEVFPEIIEEDDEEE